MREVHGACSKRVIHFPAPHRSPPSRNNNDCDTTLVSLVLPARARALDDRTATAVLDRLAGRAECRETP